jgi:nucleoside-diphosphate-sugar epimerase
MLPSKKVLITGIDGFTGKHLELYLTDKGMAVYGTTIEHNDSINQIYCDLRNYNEIESVILQIKPDYVIHLAAISFTGENNRALIYDTNILATENLLSALRTNHIPEKIILASSASVYGNQEVNELHETLCPKPVNHYGISKLAMEHIAQTYFDTLNILIVRPFNYTGPGQGEHFLIPKIISHYQQNKSSIDLGNLDVAREFNDIRFVVDIYYQLMLSSNKSDIVNLCTGKAWELSTILELLSEISGYTIKVNINQSLCRPNEIKILNGSPSKLHTLIPLSPVFSMYETLQHMYNFKPLSLD